MFFETSKKKMYVTSVPCPAMYYTDMIYRSNDRDMPKHKRNCTEKGRLTYVTNSSENNLCLCEVDFSFQSKERYCDPSIENCTCRRNTPDSKNKGTLNNWSLKLNQMTRNMSEISRRGLLFGQNIKFVSCVSFSPIYTCIFKSSGKFSKLWLAPLKFKLKLKLSFYLRCNFFSYVVPPVSRQHFRSLTLNGCCICGRNCFLLIVIM